MKKIYALAAVAMMAVAANAQNGAPLYLVGSGNLGWEPSAPKEFVYADGVYTYEAVGAEMQDFKISTAMGDWDTFNESAIGVPDYGSEADVEKPLEPWGENTRAPWAGEWKIIVKGDLSTLTLKALSEKQATKVFVRGDMNGWGTEEAWQLTQPKADNENVFEFVAEGETAIFAGIGFKFADSAWGSINLGNENDGDVMVFDAEMPLSNSSNSKNITLDEEFEGKIFLQIEPAMVYFSTDMDTANPFLSNSVHGIQMDTNSEAVYFNLQGVRVAQPENGLYIVVKDGKAVKTLVK